MPRLSTLIEIETGKRIDFESNSADDAWSIGGEHIQNGNFSLQKNPRRLPIEFYKSSKKGRIQIGDTLFVKDGATLGKSMFVDSLPFPHLLVNEHVFVLRPRKIHPKYLSFLLQSNLTQFSVWAGVMAAAQPGIGRDFAKAIDVPFTDLSTQREIADFLDRETARIDLLIEKKQKLVALLGEKFETETTRLMTRGVRGDVTEFAKSIYHWAPDVPSHWTQTPLRQLLRLASGSVGEKSGDYVLLSLTKKGVIPRDVESGKGKFPSDFSAYQVVKPNQLVLCLFDIDETPRTVGLSNEHGMVTGAYTVADINADRVDHYFIYFHLLYIDNGKRLRPFYTGLRKVVRPQTFLNIRIPLPPMDEQKQIVQELQHWERRAKSISEKTNASIDRLKEYRSALITAAVTGQIDVSTYAKSGANDRRLDAIEEVFE